jgi:hypothetical protein
MLPIASVEPQPTGTTVTEAKKSLDTKYLDGRKLSALKFWGIIEESGDGRLKLMRKAEPPCGIQALHLKLY